MGQIDLQLLGPFRAAKAGLPIADSAWPRKKSKALVKLLALAPQRRMLREQLIKALWPEAEPDSGSNNLNKVLHAARRVFEPDLQQGAFSRYLLTQDAYVALAPAPLVHIDLEDFEAAAATALRSGEAESLEKAIALYSGDLLAEDLYDDAASVRREQVRALYLRVLDRLAAVLEAAGDPRAVEILSRIVGRNPADESAQRRLMRAYARSGQRFLALDQYRVCREALARDFNAQPEAATTALYQELLAAASGESATPLPPAQPAAASAVSGKPRRLVLPAIALLLLLLAGSAAWYVRAGKGEARSAPRSVAILPLRSKGGGVDLDSVAEGITEGLINGASRVTGLRVMARATVFAYQGSRDPIAVGKALHVSAVVNGRVEQEGAGYRVALELIDAADGSRLWGRQFFAPNRDLATLQQSVNSELAAAMAPPRSSNAPAAPRKVPSGAGEAYRFYLRGRYFSNQRTAAGLRRSITEFGQAAALDPLSALSYAGLADSYGLLGVSTADPAEFMPKARAAAERAIQLDPTLAEAHTSLAMVNALYEWNWAAAERSFQRAILENDGYATAHHWYGVHLAAMGRFQEAAGQLSRALELDPLSPVIQLNSGYPFLYQRRFAEALQAYARALELKPDFALAHEDRMLPFERLGRNADAAREAVLFLQESGDAALAAKMQEQFRVNRYPDALRFWLDQLEARARSGYVPPMLAASLAIRSGDPERCLLWLERAFAQRAPLLVYAGVDPTYDALRRDSRFRNLLQRVGLLVN